MTWAAYLPGLSGGFLFDDFVNLNALGSSGPVDDWETFWRYITSGTADPTGRPLALLSFLIDANNWPALPAPFLRTNVLLHLGNGILLFCLLRQLGAITDSPGSRNDASAILASGLWLLHPLFVSTTLYIVQREAMLPATFTLLGLMAYTRGRTAFAESGGTCGQCWMMLGLGTATVLAVLSKGNGVLLPLLAGVLEVTVFSGSTAALGAQALARLRRLQSLMIVVPTLLVVAYMARYIPTMFDPLPNRSWTVAERLMTEPRVLFDYIRLLIIPRSVSSGLFNDAYSVSRSLLQPGTTIPALAAVLGAVAIGFAARAKAPVLAAAVLFFFAGHLLESSFIPLELYFEHRNYLPALLFFWPLSRTLWQSKISMKWAAVGSTILLIVVGITTWQRTTLWGSPAKMAALWARQNAASPRAQAAAAIEQIRAGQPQAALDRLIPIWKRYPNDLQIGFNVIDARCRAGGPSVAEKAALGSALRHTRKRELLIHTWLGSAVQIAETQTCPGLSLVDVEQWITSAMQNPYINTSENVRHQNMTPLLAMLAIRRGLPDLALMRFNRSLVAVPSPHTAARQASILASNGYYHQALAHLDTYEAVKAHGRRPAAGMPMLHAKVIELQGYWPREMAILRSKLHAEIKATESGMPR